jgi:hypothetical protein
MTIRTQQSDSLAEVKFTSVTGLPSAGSYIWRFGVEFALFAWMRSQANEEDDRPSIRLEDARLRVQSSAAQLLVGDAVPEIRLLSVASHAQQRSIGFEVVVSAAAIECIEHQRAGGDVTFWLKLRVIVSAGRSQHEATEDVICTVPQSEWLKVLESCGYCRTLVVEVPMPDAAQGADPAAACLVLDAQRHLHRGQFDACIVCCRKALEAQATAAEALEQGEEPASIKLRDQSLPQRLKAIRKAVMHFANLSAHADPLALSQPYGRDDAILMLRLTAAMIVGRPL